MPIGRLSSDQVLRDNKAADAAAISELKLYQKALSDVSCLRDFKNLQRLDLGFNSLTSLEDLKPCLNLKWLSVVQNKLHSLKGVEALSNLTVLNAGKNKLTSMEEVQSLVGLRALILNDNDITSICKLDQMKELNTLVLSRNPITNIGKSLVKVKSLTKLSLSNCKLQAIDSSLKSCIELKELRLAHNNIQTLPPELAQNAKLQNLDLGNNLIARWSDVKVLQSLVNLKNLNLLGNPIAENEKLAKKVRKALPNLQIFNAKPINLSSKNELHQSESSKVVLCTVDDFMRMDRKRERQKSPAEVAEEMEKKGKKKSKEKLSGMIEKKANKKSHEQVKTEMATVDDEEVAELFQAEDGDDARTDVGEARIAPKQASVAEEAADLPTRKKKKRKMKLDPSLLGSSEVEVGMGGPSSWDD